MGMIEMHNIYPCSFVIYKRSSSMDVFVSHSHSHSVTGASSFCGPYILYLTAFGVDFFKCDFSFNDRCTKLVVDK